MPEKALPCQSISELARHFGRSRAAVRGWFRSKGWPGNVPCRGPWSKAHVAAISRFVDGLKPGPGSAKYAPGAATAADVAVKEERCKLLRLQRAVLAKRYHSREKCEARMMGAIAAVKSNMQTLAATLPAELSNTDPTTWTGIIEGRFNELCNFFAEGVRPGWLKGEHPADVEPAPVSNATMPPKESQQ